MRTFLLANVFVVLVFSGKTWGQSDTIRWDLNACLAYALENNIQLKKAGLSVDESEINYKESKSSRYPNLNASAGASFTNQQTLNPLSEQYEWGNYFSNNYSLRTEVDIYNGNINTNRIKQNFMKIELQQLNLEEANNSIIIAITESFLNVLYTYEAFNQAKTNVLESESQLEKSQNLFNAGSITNVELNQVKSQLFNDKYALVEGENNYQSSLLSLKQLLELNYNINFDIETPHFSDDQILKAIIEKDTAINISLRDLPQIKSANSQLEIMKLDYSIAKASYLPKLSLSASIASGHNTENPDSWNNQINHNFYQNVGLTLNIPIYTKRNTKSNVERAYIGIETAKLNLEEAKKEVWKEVELAHQQAVAAQQKYVSAKEQTNALKQTFDLINEQFTLGMKNSFEWLSAKNNLTNAHLSLLQAKYSAILYQKILDFYTGKPIDATI